MQKRITVLPVSGGSFPAQIAMMRLLINAEAPRPHLMMGTSGGNVVGYLAMASNFDADRLLELACSLEGHMFVEPWGGYLSKAQGFFKGSAYRASDKGMEMFKQLFKGGNCGDIEMWSSTTERSTGKVQLWCNRSHRESMIKALDLNLHNNCRPLRYINGDVDKMAKICMASASIPGVVTPQDIDGEDHQDGGVMFASPISALSRSISENTSKYGFHMDYISCCDCNDDAINNGGNLLKVGECTLKQLMAAHRVSDRIIAANMAYRTNDGYSTTVSSGTCTVEALRRIEEERKTAYCSVLELFPSKSMEINIVNIKSNDVRTMISECEQWCQYRLWVCRKR